ncbi:MAG: DUF2334 domain-containing protein [Betaproteobacteria bacterium]
MKNLLRHFIGIALVVMATFAHAQAPLKTLILYDAPPAAEYEKLGFAYAIMLKNLLSHFDSDADMLPVQLYSAGKLNAYDATFYLGAYYNNPVPANLLADIKASAKTVVWFNYNLWQFTWDAQYGFAQQYGFSLDGLRGLNAVPTAADPAPGFFDTIAYKNKDFVKYYAYDSVANQVNADPDIGQISITDPAKASALVSIRNPTTAEEVPYIVRSGKFWYIADMPFSYIGPRDRYLVLTDMLHDILGVNHAENHRAMVRLEDVDAMVSVAAMKTLSDYLQGRQIPFSIATVPKYVDSLGAYNDGVPLTIPLSAATNLRTALDYGKARGAEIVMHGYTHQYSNIENIYTGVSSDDYEFWNMVTNSPVAEDSIAWASGRYDAGLADLAANGYPTTVWEAPHYQGSALSYKAVPAKFPTTYQRVVYYTADNPSFIAAPGKDFAVGQIFPYIINKDYYGQRIIPENLGNIEYDISDIDPASNFNYTWQDLYINAQYALTVRDGFASFFFHPFWLEPDIGKPGLQDFKNLVEGMTALGYTWTSPSQLVAALPATPLLASVVSRKTHGAAGDFSLAVDSTQPVTGAVTIEPRAIGAGHVLIFAFDTVITSAGTVTVEDSAGMAIGTATAAAAGMTVVVTLSAVPDKSRVAVTLAHVNGGATAVTASVGFLLGDVNGDRSVSAIDVTAVKARAGEVARTENFMYDVNTTGFIGAADISGVKMRLAAALGP